MSNISRLCDEIKKHLTALGLHTATSLLPGLTEDKILQMTAELPFVLPHSVVELYKWSEGLRPNSGIGNSFFPGYRMDALPEMMETYRELSSDSEFPRFRAGNIKWFPIFRSGGTDFYGVLCGSAAEHDGEVVDDDNEGEHRDGITPPAVTFVSLEAMLQTLLRCYETGIYYMNKRGQLDVGDHIYDDTGRWIDIDLSKFNEVARQFNPGIEYRD